MLAGLRGPNDFIGVQYLLDPTQHHGVRPRWGRGAATAQHAQHGRALVGRRGARLHAVGAAAGPCGYHATSHQSPLLSVATRAPVSPCPQLAERWRPVVVARTEVQGVLLTRPAVELVLKHYPLAQVGRSEPGWQPCSVPHASHLLLPSPANL